MAEDRLPSFVIIGAAKSATTWLTHNLQRHRQVFVPSVEIDYFSCHYEKGMSWYLAHFAGARGGQVVGEKSNTYLTSPDAPHRLKASLPHARLIVQLRNPIERAYSHYCMHLRDGLVSPDVDLYLDVTRTPTLHFVETGLYCRHLARFLKQFPLEQILALLHEDVRVKPASVLQAVCAHIGVDAPIAPDVIARRINDREIPNVDPRIRGILWPLKRFSTPHQHKAWFRLLRSSLGSLPAYPVMSKATRDRLREFYRDDVEALSSILDRDLRSWLASDVSSDAA
jgi:Sulfotransferase domain